MPLNPLLPMTGLLVLALLGGCVGGERLSTSMATLNQEYGELQDEALLHNILRRSVSLPAHFTSVSTIRGRSRVDAGANLSVPFGADASSQFTFNPQISIEQGPWFEVALLDNKEFYRGYLAPISTTTASYYLQAPFPRELLFTLLLSRIDIHRPGSDDTRVVNSPGHPDQYQAFQRVVRQLVDEGLTLEMVSLVNQVGPTLHMQDAPSLDDLLSVNQQDLTIQETEDARHYHLVKVGDAARFCFSRAHDPLFRQAYCDFGVGHQYAASDPRFFGSTGRARVSFVSEGQGSIELYVRSLAELLDYLGEVVHAQQTTGQPLMVRTAAGEQPFFHVMPVQSTDSAAVATEFDGVVYGIPAGAAGGQSGNALTIVSQIMAQAQSIENQPTSSTVTVIGE
ncbi:hypothetical protein GCM10027040_20970 [Halomonas shantousis]